MKTKAPDTIDDSLNGQVIISDDQDCLCLDALSGVYFKSNMNRLKEIENTLNSRMLRENYVLLEEFYEELEVNGGDIGSLLGWNIESGYIELEFSSGITQDGRLALVVSHAVLPKPMSDNSFASRVF